MKVFQTIFIFFIGLFIAAFVWAITIFTIHCVQANNARIDLAIQHRKTITLEAPHFIEKQGFRIISHTPGWFDNENYIVERISDGKIYQISVSYRYDEANKIWAVNIDSIKSVVTL